MLVVNIILTGEIVRIRVSTLNLIKDVLRRRRCLDPGVITLASRWWQPGATALVTCEGAS